MKSSTPTEDEPGTSTTPAAGGILRHHKSILRSFRFAWEGLLFCFNTQRHMRIHFAIMFLFLLAAASLRVSALELLMMVTAMALVLITEMINTAIEATVDLTAEGYDPRAKVAKDVAAGAVLLAALYSVIVGITVLARNQRLAEIVMGLPSRPEAQHLGIVQLVVIGLLLLGIIITWAKQRSGRGTLWRGGIISGHTAFGFLIATTIALATRDLGVTALGLGLALLVAQSRLQARIHSPAEVLIGGALGIATAFILFMWPA
jgi:diacylglycerol kinase (ATP)